MKYVTVKDLIKKLQEFDGDLPVIITHDGKDHQYGIKEEDIKITQYAYFGNDPDADKAFPTYDFENEKEINREFLNLGYF